jgi:hypothetical protein
MNPASRDETKSLEPTKTWQRCRCESYYESTLKSCCFSRTITVSLLVHAGLETFKRLNHGGIPNRFL